MADRALKVVGYFAFLSAESVVCTDAGACVITGSASAMRQIVEELHPGHATAVTIKKTRFAEVVRGLALGAAYAFDEEAYRRFFPLGRDEGIPLERGDFASAREKGYRFFTVQVAGGLITTRSSSPPANKHWW